MCGRGVTSKCTGGANLFLLFVTKGVRYGDRTSSIFELNKESFTWFSQTYKFSSSELIKNSNYNSIVFFLFKILLSSFMQTLLTFVTIPTLAILIL